MASNINRTPTNCLADFSLVPTNYSKEEGYATHIAKVQRLLDESGLKHEMHATGTSIEGPWDRVLQVVGYAHTLVHQEGSSRIETDIRISTSANKNLTMEDEVASVERLL